MFTFKEIKNIDTIEVNRDKSNSINSWFTTNRMTGIKTLPMRILNEGIIKLIYSDDAIFYTYFKFLDDQHIYVEHYKYCRDIYEFGCYFSVILSLNEKGNIIETDYKAEKYINDIAVGKRDEVIKSALVMFLMTMEYLQYLIENPITVNKSVNTIPEETQPKSNKKPAYKVSTTNDKKSHFVILDGIKVTSTTKANLNNMVKRKYERHTESWSVRGHHRKTKNGDMIPVKPFVKGSKKNITPKTYVLSVEV